MDTGIVFDIMRFSIKDGPGIRTTVFFKGCPLRCGWCHNPESQGLEPELILWQNRCINCGGCVDACTTQAISLTFLENEPVIARDEEYCTWCQSCVNHCPAGAWALVGKEVSVDEVLQEVRKDIVFYDESGGGVTFSGGEPLNQPHFLRTLLQQCKMEDIHTVVDTSGFTPLGTLLDIGQYVDVFLYDLKIMDDARHKHYTGVSNKIILDNLAALKERGMSLVVRFPLIPGITDDDDNLVQMARFLKAHSVGVIEVLPYHDTAKGKYHRLGQAYMLSKIKPPTLKEIERAVDVFTQWGIESVKGGLGNVK